MNSIDVPIGLPYFRCDGPKEAGPVHLMAEFGLEELGRSPDRHEEVDAGGMPALVLGGDGSSGDNIVDMGVAMELAAPGVKDPEETWQVAAHILFIGSQSFDGL